MHKSTTYSHLTIWTYINICIYIYICTYLKPPTILILGDAFLKISYINPHNSPWNITQLIIIVINTYVYVGAIPTSWLGTQGTHFGHHQALAASWSGSLSQLGRRPETFATPNTRSERRWQRQRAVEPSRFLSWNSRPPELEHVETCWNYCNIMQLFHTVSIPGFCRCMCLIITSDTLRLWLFFGQAAHFCCLTTNIDKQMPHPVSAHV